MTKSFILIVNITIWIYIFDRQLNNEVKASKHGKLIDSKDSILCKRKIQ